MDETMTETNPVGSAPEGLPQWDNQTNSGTCVRFSIAKAVANHLFVRRNIDVDQNQIMISLVQAKKSICAVRPIEYDDTTILLQDVNNDKEGYGPMSWWEVLNFSQYITKIVNIFIYTYNLF